jgi:hypothetical protein
MNLYTLIYNLEKFSIMDNQQKDSLTKDTMSVMITLKEQYDAQQHTIPWNDYIKTYTYQNDYNILLERITQPNFQEAIKLLDQLSKQ